MPAIAKTSDSSPTGTIDVTHFTPASPPRAGALLTKEGTSFSVAECLSKEGLNALTGIWFEAANLALTLAADNAFSPTINDEDYPVWDIGPLTSAQTERINNLVAGSDRNDDLGVHAFLAAMVDAVPRLALAGDQSIASSDQDFIRWEGTPRPELRPWAQGIDNAGSRSLLVIKVTPVAEPLPTQDHKQPGDQASDSASIEAQLVAVMQIELDQTVDIADAWTDLTPSQRSQIVLTLRRAARLWPPLERLLYQAVPTQLALEDSEVLDLAGPISHQLLDVGIAVHWPNEIARGLEIDAELFDTPMTATSSPPADTGNDAPFGGNSLFSFQWKIALGGVELSKEELDALAKASSPVVRLRNRWVVLDEASMRALQPGKNTQMPAISALAMALDGVTELGGRTVKVHATGRLGELEQSLLAPVPPSPEDFPSFRRPVPTALTATLREYQRDGLDWLDRMTSWGLGAVLADDMGLGKTITLIALHARRQENPATADPTLVVCPASLLGNWNREINRFAPDTKVTRFHGPSRNLSHIGRNHIVLTTYATMRSDVAGPAQLLKRSWGLVVADEAQQVKNPATRTARALRSVPGTARVALTGTPVENTLEELWAILDWTTPGLLGPRARFKARWANPIAEGSDPLIAKRFARLIKPFVLRRAKSDPGIAPELPPKTETDRPVSLTPEQVGLYEALLQDTMEQINGSEGFARRGLIVALLTGLKQICNHPAQYLHENPRSFGRSFAARSGKVELLDELVDTIISEGGSVLVFTQYVAMAKLLSKHLETREVSHLLLHGGTAVPQREAMVDSFQRGDAHVFLLSLKAAGTGLNLTRADHVIHLDRWWNPAVEDQATDRAYRIGQTRPVQVHRFVAEGTIEDRIAELLAAKRDLADSVLTTGEGAFTELSNTDLASLVELRGAS